jgi:hypothetical protein
MRNILEEIMLENIKREKKMPNFKISKLKLVKKILV